MKQNLLLSIALAMLAVVSAFAQTRTVSGKVTAADDGSPLPGVSVLIKGTTTGTTTDVNGAYRLANVPEKATLVFSYVGFIRTEVEVGQRTELDLALKSDEKILSEVVVTGYGTQEKREITGAIASVSGQTIQNLPVQSFDRALQGRAAGVQVTALSGQPGGGINVRVRGVGSINAGNDPLYIVDGVQVANGGLGGQASTNVLNSINPNDIESIEVLKDAAAASIYGAQAANGVVLITTKRGKTGRTQFEFSAQEGVVDRLKKLDVLTATEFAQLKIEGFTNRALAQGQDATGVNSARQTAIGSFGDPATVRNTDWQEVGYRRGRLRTYDLSARGGDEKTKFFLSASYNLQEGQVIKSDFRRGTVRLNVDHKATDKLAFEVSINLSSTTQNGTIADGAFINSPIFAGPLIMPYQPVFKEDGSFNSPLAGAFSFNILESVTYETRKSLTNQTVSNFALNYVISPNLRFRSFYGIDYAANRDDNYRDLRVPQFAPTGGSATVQNRTTLNWNTAQTLNFSKRIGDHNLGGLLGAEYREEVRETVTATGQGFPNGLFTTLAAAARPITTTGDYTTWRIASLFGNAKYDYKDKYLATFTLRYDGSSRFGANTRWGLFYAGSLGWRLTGEEFLKNSELLDDLKLRASYGLNGNSQIANFASRALFGLGGQYLDLPGIDPSQLGNNNLSWEVAKTLDFGLDASLFKGRLSATVDVYQRRNERLLLNRQLPSDSGFGAITENVGVVRNRGLEIALNTVNIDAGGFKWATSFNITFQDNKILELNEGRQNIGTNIRVGYPVQINWFPQYAGVNPADGRVMWLDTLGNITYNPQARDFTVIGSPIPQSFGGLTNTFSYKGITLEVFFQGQFGGMHLNNDAFFMENSVSSGWNNLRSQLDGRWLRPGDVSQFPRTYEGGVEPGSAAIGTFSGRHIERGDYIRLKQVTLSYGLPGSVLSKIKLRQVRFFVQALNLLTWTAYTGFDPELLGSGLGRYPQSRQVTGGISVGF
ncbi:MAG: TonB-dependent receptor [Bernardetiaceae bacterium]|nr:TonB-dependent receptor [Bernardetiaceae bacterium]